MISFIANLLRTVLFGFLLNDYLKRTYPKTYDDFLIATSFNVIYSFSVIQIKLRGIKDYMYITNPRLAELLDTYNRVYRVKNNKNIDCVLDGKIIYSTIFNNSITDYPKNQDFIIYSDYKNVTRENKCVNKKLLTQLNADEKFDYERSDIKFMLVELKIGDNSFKIDFKTDDYNFYIVGNCFTKKFFLYYLTEILKINEMINDNDKFSFKIIDHDVNTVELEFTDKTDSILLEKNGYKLSITNDNEQKE